LYEDENDNYNYEKGVHSTIIFSWNNQQKVLTIGDRKGAYPGMLTNRKFNIVLVRKEKGTGSVLSENFDKIVGYSGKKLVIKL
jgi:alpha-D-xyloside xylohydrolase